ncbi:MAG TPA: selenoprotein B glycine/betaine/sarcosine/D-proline reductase, partial [Acidimicrobiaceae bacterium]|nr:selenoprotein B glycine/betaine/sarcosine/D-proline reductase [Acidimicrobiaceae bacterium]
MSGDVAMRALGDNFPTPTFENPAWVTPTPLAEAKVAIVTSAAIHTTDDDRFSQGDTSYRFVPREARDLVLGHWSPNFDRTGFTLDLNVVYPIDRLEELAEQGVIGSIA